LAGSIAVVAPLFERSVSSVWDGVISLTELKFTGRFLAESVTVKNADAVR